MNLGFCVETINKDVFFEEPFKEVVKRMGWALSSYENNWLVAFPAEDEELFDFVFGV